MSKKKKDEAETVLCNVVDTVCGQLLVQQGVMNNLIRVCADFKIEIMPLLKEFQKKQDNTLKEIFPHTSQAFQYGVDNKGEKFVESLKVPM